MKFAALLSNVLYMQRYKVTPDAATVYITGKISLFFFSGYGFVEKSMLFVFWTTRGRAAAISHAHDNATDYPGPPRPIICSRPWTPIFFFDDNSTCRKTKISGPFS